MRRIPKNPLARITTISWSRESKTDVRCLVEPWARGKNIIEVEFFRQPSFAAVQVLELGMHARVPGAPEPRWHMVGDAEWRTDSILQACSDVAALIRYEKEPQRAWKIGLMHVGAFTEVVFLRKPTEDDLMCLSPMQGAVNDYAAAAKSMFKNKPPPTTFKWRRIKDFNWRTDSMREALNG